MTYVIQKDPDLHENKRVSPWKGCLWIDPDSGKGYHATSLAKPTQFDSKKDVEKWADKMRHMFPGSEIRIAEYEKVFQASLLPVQKIQDKRQSDGTGLPGKTSVDLNTVSADSSVDTEVSSWDWNEVDDDIPF